MATIAQARQGDTLDGLLWRDFGLDVAAVPATLAANPGLAALGAVLPAGTVITIPAATQTPAARPATVQLWD